MPKLLKCSCLVFSVSILLSTIVFAEDITITTYYPSPFGNYRELRAQRVAIGDAYIASSYCWPPTACATQIDTDADLVVQGNVGIGNTNPAFALDVTGRSRIRTGGGTAGIWFMNAANTVNRAFTGMANDDYVGFWGNNGAGWGLNMNVNNGNVGLGTMGPTQKLDVNGRVRMRTLTANADNSDIVTTKSYVEAKELECVTVTISRARQADGTYPGGAATCAAGYVRTGCAWACNGNEGPDWDQILPANGCALDNNSQCTGSVGTFRISAICCRIKPGI